MPNVKINLKIKKSSTVRNINNSCPVPTPPSTPMETKGQKSSTIRALYCNDPVVTSPSTSVVRKETDTNMTLSDSEQIVNICSSSEDDTSDSDVTSDSDNDYICSELDTSDESKHSSLIYDFQSYLIH